ncbi:MAG: sulfite exporter TauE/SafE family protein [Desulfovibrionaceae bacterium]|nr:sulfite exporter TauE/SafE family protein [Desulfovibrionaceae bacterium]MBF0514687.1 sulfite exporter TauE/SafE family protein [Desulfovibrionaceae bacterium]
MDIVHLLIVGLAAVAGGAVNALAGGGTLITFPVLTAVGVPMVAANITNTVALCPGYLGATFAQKRDLRGQALRLWLLLPAGVVGGIGGGILLLHTDDAVFGKVVPYLIIMAVVLMAAQDKIRAWLMRRAGKEEGASLHDAWALLPIIPAAVYGGFFGAGVSVIVIAVLGLVMSDSIIRLNALKQAVSFAINTAAAIFFLFSGQVVWSAAMVMAVGAIAGGVIGGRLAGRIRPLTLRRIVIGIGSAVALIYLIR